jgi:hypothetical protein
MINIAYTPPPTLARFLQSSAFVRAIMGPIGSGKSSVCAVEIVRRAMEQHPGPDGFRRSRFAIIRNTYRELQDTTRKTFEEWVPDALGKWSEADLTFTLAFDDVRAEILFRALDRPEDVRKLLSLELTGAWINEAREIPKPVFDMIQGRIGRYPSKNQGGPTWYGLWLDTNPPDRDHWFYRVFEELRPAEHILFRQPGARDLKAENRDNLPPRYYERLLQGKDDDWVKVFVDGDYGFIKEGRPIYPEWNDHVHIQAPTLAASATTILVGVDFGLTPAAVFGQRDPKDGQLQIFHEITSESLGAVRFFEEVVTYLKSSHPGRSIRGWGDPAGEQRSQVDERTPYNVAAAAGLPLVPTHTNDFTIRRESVANALTRLTLLGRPSLVIDSSCLTLRKAMAGGYSLKRIQVSGQERFRDVPDKNRFSHPAEALQYLAVGEGLDGAVLDGRLDFQRRTSKMKSKRALGSSLRRAMKEEP